MSYFIRYTDTFLSGEIFLTFNESDALEIQFFFADTLVTPLKRLLMWLHTVLTAASCFLVPNHFSTWIDTCQIIIKNKREPCIDIQLTEKFTISTGTFYIKIIIKNPLDFIIFFSWSQKQSIMSNIYKYKFTFTCTFNST